MTAIQELLVFLDAMLKGEVSYFYLWFGGFVTLNLLHLENDMCNICKPYMHSLLCI